MIRGAEFQNFLVRFSARRWFHVVFNYLGLVAGHGYRVYYNGKQVAGDEGIRSHPRAQQVDAKIAIGRKFTGVDGFYSSLMVDELLFFNQPLTNDEIRALSM